MEFWKLKVATNTLQFLILKLWNRIHLDLEKQVKVSPFTVRTSKLFFFTYIYTYIIVASSDSEAIISSLRQRVNEFINKETVAVENRIRKFTEDQYKALNEYRDRVFKEQHVLKM